MGRTIKLLIYYITYSYGIGALLYAGYMAVHHTTALPSLSEPSFFTLNMWAQVLSALAVSAHLLVWKYVDSGQMRLNFPHTGAVMFASALLIVRMGFWTNYLTELAGLPDEKKQLFELAMNHPMGIIAIVIMAPFMEELLFRGAMQGHLLRKWKRPVWAIVVPALIFGAVHGNPVQIPFAFVTGLALGWIYYQTGSLLPGMLMHFINNGTSALLYHLSGKEDQTMTEAFGTSGAAGMAFAGATLTVLCIWYVKRTLPARVSGQENENSPTD